MRFLLRDRRGERDLLEEHLSSVMRTFGLVRSRLEAAKHASAGDIVAVQGYLLSVEALLVELLLVN